MQELIGRLTAVDPAISESLKIIDYFDALAAGGASAAAIVRGAAMLSGTTAGAVVDRRRHRFLSTGRPATDEELPHRPALVRGGCQGWLERAGEPLANDEMIVERMTIALATARTVSPAASAAVEVLTGSGTTIDERGAAAAVLGLSGRPMRILATRAADHIPPEGPETIVPTRFGLIRISITDSSTVQMGRVRVGIGVAAAPLELAGSWHSALTALRMTTVSEPRVDAADLGVLILAAGSEDDVAGHSDVVRLRQLAARPLVLETLDALSAEPSLRAAAHRLNLHHSTLQAKVPRVIEELGYDPRTRTGRIRYEAARVLATLDAEPLQ